MARPTNKDKIKALFDEYTAFIDKGIAEQDKREYDFLKSKCDIVIELLNTKVSKQILADHEAESNPYHAGRTIYTISIYAITFYPFFIEEPKEGEIISFNDEAFKYAIMYILGEVYDKTYLKAVEPFLALKPFLTSPIQEDIFKTLQGVIPKTYYIQDDKLQRKLPDIPIDGVTRDLITGIKDIKCVISLSYEGEGLKMYSKNPFTVYDRAVHNAVVSLLEAGNKHFTPEMVYRAMNGLTGTEYVSPQATEAITKSIDKSISTIAKIDSKELLTHYGITPVTLEAHVLEARKITVKAGGTKKVAYEFISKKKPVLYEYCQYTGQIKSIEAKLLNTTKIMSNGAETTILRETLIRYIEQIKSKNEKRNPKIKYDRFYELADIKGEKPDNDKVKKKQVRDKITKLLNHYKSIGYIKEFEEYKAGRTIEGVKIII